MSDVSGFRTSRASSLSIFSGLGTSSASVASESCQQFNVDELSDHQLYNVLEDLRMSVKQLNIETAMFESYFDRLVSKASGIGDKDASRAGSRKCSVSSQPSLTESDSRPTTAAGGDYSHTTGRRKRSSSRTTSVGGKGKSLKITTEQKLYIAKKELELVEERLDRLRSKVDKDKHDGRAQIEERALTLRETIKTRDRLAKSLEHCIATRNGKKFSNPDLLCIVMENEVKSMHRQKIKLKTKNMVLKGQKAQINRKIKQLLAKSELTGPVDLNQLQLENIRMTDVISAKNVEIRTKRYAIALTKAKKAIVKEMLKKFEVKEQQLIKRNEDAENHMDHLTQSINNLQMKITKQRQINTELLDLISKHGFASVDVYFDLKVSLIQYEKHQKSMDRKRHLEWLAKKNRRSKVFQMVKHSQADLSKRPSLCPKNHPKDKIQVMIPNLFNGKVCKGPTFDIRFEFPKIDLSLQGKKT